MISHADVEKLRSIRAPEPAVLSLYLPVPLDPAGLPGLAAQAEDLMASAGAGHPDGAGIANAGAADRAAVLGALAAHGRDWLGHTVAFFACQQLALFEVLPLPCVLSGRAVLATRPYVRPLLAANQRCPDYLAAIISRRDAWVLSVSGDRVETVARRTAAGPRSPRPGGRRGPETHRTQQRASQPGRHHYRDAAAALERATGAGRPVPLVIGGHHDSITGLAEALPPAVREAFAGSFAADPHTLIPARIRELASPVIDSWTKRREQELAEQTLGGLCAVGLHASLAAVNEGAVARLLVAHEGMIAGYVCGCCGALGTGCDECPHWGTAARAVPDLVEEMVQRTLDDNAPVTMIRDAPFCVAAKLRFPVTGTRSAVRGEGGTSEGRGR
jgi:Bacterial archaeo-eukaryotic release factor family 10